MDLSKVLVGICLPIFDRQTSWKFTISFRVMDILCPNTFAWPQGPGPMDKIRNTLAKNVLRASATHVFFMDTDQVYPRDTLMRLLAHDLPVVGAKVHRRFNPYEPIMYRGECPHYKRVPSDEWSKGGLIEVDATGTGCLLIRSDVFEAIPEPWFEHRRREDDLGDVGEDIDFCTKVRSAGIPIYVDADVKLGHIGEFVITEESFWNYKFDQEINI